MENHIVQKVHITIQTRRGQEKYLRELKKTRPELFDKKSMNGDLTKEGKDLNDTFYTIVEKAGYDHIQRYIPKNHTRDLLRAHTQSRKESDLLRSQKLTGGSQRRRVISNLPKNSGVNIADIPKHCYYRPATKNRSDYFVIEGHPNLTKNTWQTTSSKKLTTKEKFNELLDYYNTL